MKKYKDQIIELLRSSHWEIAEIIPGDAWWELEHWRVSSSREHRQIWISMICHNGEGFQSSVDEIRASTSKPPDRINDESTIAKLNMMKGLFNEKVPMFIESINRYRNSEKNK